jgi:hypothetical protein
MSRRRSHVLRWLIGVLMLCLTSAAVADPILLLLLRMARDRALSASIEAGVNTMQQSSTIPSPLYGFALPTPAIPRGNEEQELRTLLDENFLHLSAAQRDEVFEGLQAILKDPQHRQDKSRLVAEFALKAREVRDSYRGLDKLSYAEKRSLAAQARTEYSRMPAAERRQFLEVLQSGTLPIPRDLREILLAEINRTAPVTAGNDRHRE